MNATLAAVPAKDHKEQAGLGFWMLRAQEECDRASVDFAADPVHDLRVALRRCRSMADGFMAMDPSPAWKQMKKAAKAVFSCLGELRDVQVMKEWLEHLGRVDDPVTVRLGQFLSARESHLKSAASDALRQFDRKQWKRWSVVLPRRAKKVRLGGAIFKHLALERWTEAYGLHQRALRNRSQVAFHSLRIGIKRFRYIVENFLPEQHVAWSNDLKRLQDLLGEVHDLDVLWATALQTKAFPDAELRKQWRTKITEERDRRIHEYRSRMLGKDSLWHKWRAELPSGPQIVAAALSRLKLWGSLLDPDVQHANHVTDLALQIYDGLPPGEIGDHEWTQQRAILQLAALLHDVGRSKKKENHHKTTFKLITRLPPPLGWSRESMRLAAAVARYHRGALPRIGQKTMVDLPSPQRLTVLRLAGILRLADAMDTGRESRIKQLHLHRTDGSLVIAAQGYSPRDRAAEQIAAGRHLLETVCRLPILIKPMRVTRDSIKVHSIRRTNSPPA